MFPKTGNYKQQKSKGKGGLKQNKKIVRVGFLNEPPYSKATLTSASSCQILAVQHVVGHTVAAINPPDSAVSSSAHVAGTCSGIYIYMSSEEYKCTGTLSRSVQIQRGNI